jgi:hypothetical protein
MEYHHEIATISSLYAAGNAGHLLWEAFAPPFGAVNYFGIDTEGLKKRRTLHVSTCEDPNEDILYGYPIQNCKHYMDGFGPLVSDLEPFYLTHIPADDKMHCFSDLVIANEWENAFVEEDGKTNSYAVSAAHRSMRNQIYKRLGLTLKKTGENPSEERPLRLLVQFKTSGRHGRMFQNREEVMQTIETTIAENFPGQVNVEVLNLDSTTIADQIRALASADIYFTNGGSGFYLSNMLQEGTIVVAPTQCDVRSPSVFESRPRAGSLLEIKHWNTRIARPNEEPYYVECTAFEVNMISQLSYIDVFPLQVYPGDVHPNSNYYIQPYVVKETLSRAIRVRLDSLGLTVNPRR